MINTPADPIQAVAARMEAIAAPLDEDDGVARFNELYLAVTMAVFEEAQADSYRDPEFISRLDVVFADLYFTAVDDAAAGRPIPKAWAPLFEKRHAPGIAPLQFAIAGMNAHINHDLAVALVATCEERGFELDDDEQGVSGQCRSRVNGSDASRRICIRKRGRLDRPVSLRWRRAG